MPLPFDPLCQPLLLGSLPHRSVHQALEASKRYAGALLSWPQLPQVSFREQSFVQSAAHFPGLQIDAVHQQIYVDRTEAEFDLTRLALAYLESRTGYAELNDSYAAGLIEMLRVSEHTRRAKALKGHVTGPISLAAQLTDERQRPLIYDYQLFDALIQHLRLRLMWQEARLAEVSDVTMMCIDEPFLEMVGMPFLPLDWPDVRERLDEVLSAIQGCKGLFAGGAVQWSEVLETSVELIIADVHDHAHILVDAAGALDAFLTRNGVVGLGIVPANADQLQATTREDLLQRIDAFLEHMRTAGIETERLLRRAVVAPNEALGLLSIADAERALVLVNEVSTALRTRYSLE